MLKSVFEQLLMKTFSNGVLTSYIDASGAPQCGSGSDIKEFKNAEEIA